MGKAVGYFIVVRRIKEEQKEGFILPESQNKDLRYVKGEVVSVGNLVEGIKEGEIVLYDKHAGHGCDIDGEALQVLKVGDIAYIL